MATLIIGDFRAITLQQHQLRNAEQLVDFVYLVEESAEYSWFSTNAISHIPLLSTDVDNVVIMLGFNDCTYSCVWKSFDINQISKDYIKTINSLVDQYKSLNFYVCSVNPVDIDYAFAEHDSGKISKYTLDNKIKQFNTQLQKECNATFIDCYNYLLTTTFQTRDGARFSSSTCDNILAFISSYLDSISENTFVSRDTAPIVNSDSVESDLFWLSSTYSGGLNPFNVICGSIPNTSKPYDTLPNSTAYAWGRFYEILGVEPRLLQNKNAGLWFLADGNHSEVANYNDGYARGNTPALGSIICWKSKAAGGTNLGHVAVVEKINADGSIVTSESSWQNTKYWWTTTRTNDNDNWGEDSSYIFQGFIYNPAVSGVGVTEHVDKSLVDAIALKYDGAKVKNEEDQGTIAKYIWNYLGTRGWTVNAVAGLLGNIAYESQWNPRRTNTNAGGFGLVQWTPPRKFTKWYDYYKNNLINSYHADDTKAPPLAESLRGTLEDYYDIDNQLARIEWERAQKSYYSRRKDSPYKYSTFEEFATSLDDAYTLGCAFSWDYERSAIALWGFKCNVLSSKSKYCSKSSPNDECINTCNRCRPCYEAAFGTAQTEKRAEANQEVQRQERGGEAEKWYKFLVPYAPSSGPKFTISNFKLDKIAATYIQASLVVSKGNSGTYKVLDISTTAEKEVKSGTLILTNSSNTTEFTCFSVNGLKPKTKYKLIVDVSENAGGNSISKTLVFTTAQSIPNPVSNIKLEPQDTKLPHETFKLSTELTSNFGYWKKNDHGYVIQLIINGHVKNEKIVNSLETSFTFNLNNYFKDYKSKLGDIIQIGIRTWVTDDDGSKIFDGSVAKSSNSICLLKQPVITYLNK